MKSEIRKLFFVCIIVFAFTGCCSWSKSEKEKIDERIAEAKVYLGKVKNFKDSHPEEFGQAESKISEAKSLKDKCKEESYDKASESIALSMKIDVIHMGKYAAEIKNEIEKKPAESSLRDLLPKLEKIVAYAKKVEIEQLKATVEDKDYVEIKPMAEQLFASYERSLSEKLDLSDVSFEVGKYKIKYLSDAGKDKLEKIVRRIIDAINKFPKTEKDKLTIKIDTYGYTDELPFDESTLKKELVNNGQTKVPKSPPDKRREALNENLSYFRAKTIGEYLKEKLQHEDKSLKVEIKPIGKGEVLPEEEKYKISSPYPVSDPRRRICIIDSNIL